MKKHSVISSIFALCLAMSCTDGFDESFFEKNSVTPNGNKIIGTERVYGDKGGIKVFYGTFLSNEKSMYYYGRSGTSSDLYNGSKKKHYFNLHFFVGKINELGDVAWEKSFYNDNWIGGIVQNSRNDLYIYGQKYENDDYRKYIANVSKEGVIRELNLENLPALYNVYSMRHIDNDLFLAVGLGNENNSEDDTDYLIVLKLSAMKAEIVQLAVYDINKYWTVCYVEQPAPDCYDAVLTGQNEKSQLIARKIRITNAGIVTLWEQTITNDIMQNPVSNLTSESNLSNNQAVKIDNEICIVGYGENSMEYISNDGILWKRGLVANINYSTGKINWLQTIPYKNTTIGDVKANAILHLDDNFYVIGLYNSGFLDNEQKIHYGFVQKISREGVLSNVYIFGDEKEIAEFYGGTILNRKLFLFGYKGRSFNLDFPYPNLTVNSQACQAWFVSCSINDF